MLHIFTKFDQYCIFIGGHGERRKIMAMGCLCDSDDLMKHTKSKDATNYSKSIQKHIKALCTYIIHVDVTLISIIGCKEDMSILNVEL